MSKENKPWGIVQKYLKNIYDKKTVFKMFYLLEKKQYVETQ